MKCRNCKAKHKGALLCHHAMARTVCTTFRTAMAMCTHIAHAHIRISHAKKHLIRLQRSQPTQPGIAPRPPRGTFSVLLPFQHQQVTQVSQKDPHGFGR
mmetsp:Transcript_2108/g.4087  ORF Transcript_2108/g.4087 Transcript_2108/m.4087 type:complete len:99 (-) Transcript_2108:1043-1339(-)